MEPTPLAQFEYLIKKTMTYLQFHSDDTAKDLVQEWYSVLRQVKQLKQSAAGGQASVSDRPLIDRRT